MLGCVGSHDQDDVRPKASPGRAAATAGGNSSKLAEQLLHCGQQLLACMCTSLDQAMRGATPQAWANSVWAAATRYQAAVSAGGSNWGESLDTTSSASMPSCSPPARQVRTGAGAVVVVHRKSDNRFLMVQV